jgi:hypothetical protein
MTPVRLLAATAVLAAALATQGCIAYSVASTAVGVTTKVAGTAIGVGADVVGGASDAVFTSDDERDAKAAKAHRKAQRQAERDARRR